MHSPIVILGGMGPQASLRLHQLLIEKSKTHHSGKNNEYPYIVHLSLPVADFINDESQKEVTVRTLQALTPTIDALHPASIVLACNTAHVLRPDIRLLQRRVFMPIPDIVVEALKKNGIRKVGLLASPTTIRTKLYDQILRYAGIATVLPNKGQQHSIETAIRDVIAGKPPEQSQKHLLTIAQSLQTRGAECIMLGCTELPSIFPAGYSQLPVYDCLDLCAKAVIDNFYLYNGVHI